MLNIYGNIFVFFVAGLLFVFLNMALVKIVAPRRPNREKNTTYECGEDPVGSGWLNFNARFYLIAILFVIFDVETIFLYPWAVVFRKLGLFAFVEMMLFLAILLVGFAYAWRKGALEWV